MRNSNRSIIVSVLCLAGVAGAPLVACSTSGSDAANGGPGGGDEAGVTPPLADGAVPDSTVEPPKKCAKDADCSSGVCNRATSLCVPAGCKDGVKNATETDIDCGGDCAKCDDLKSCKLAADCVSGVCKDAGTGLKCQPATTTDGVKNGIETGIDCGGTGNAKCPDGQGCKVRTDCTSDYCKAGVCTAVKADDGIQNGNETDIDCGGAGAKRCADGLKCLVDVDCASDVCKNLGDGMGLRCQAPSYSDGKKNGTETDVDCGGNPAYPCATGQICLLGSDCASLGCDYNKKCALGRSCTTHYGGDTCGFGGDGSVGPAAWESCCAKANVTASTGPTSGVTVQLDKYVVTAGRMRVFLESIGYDVRGFVRQARAAGRIPAIPGDAGGHDVLDPAWDMHLPVSFSGNQNAGEIADCSQSDTTTPTGTICKPDTEQPGIYTAVSRHIGGFIFKGNDQTLTGCYVGTDGGGGTHAFRFPDGMQDGPGIPALDQNQYDMKTMTCSDYLVGQAFCVWDGGRLVMGQETIAAWGGAPIGGGAPFAPGTMPWAAVSSTVPAEPNNRTSGTPCTTAADCGNPAPPAPPSYACVTSMCVLAGGDRTYWGCRFPWALDAAHPQCGLSWPATTSIEYADYKYSYEYPKAAAPNPNDYIVFISAPGRTRGRGPEGHADIVGNTYVLLSNVTYNADPQLARHGWSSNGSWEVHSYSKPASGTGFTSGLLNKYGKLGLRCAYPL